LLLLLLSLSLGRSATAAEDSLKLREQPRQLRTVLLSDGSNPEEGPHIETGSLDLLAKLSRTLKVLRLYLRESLYMLGRQLGSLLPLLLLSGLPSSLLLLLLSSLLSGLLLGCLLLLLLSLGVGVLLRRSRTLPQLCALTWLRSRIGLTSLWSLLSHLSILPFEKSKKILV
jgi:VIT1/CCC1 family predicted Fe2+/Mn2+ transporter